MSEAPPSRRDHGKLRFIDAMPRPLLVLFLVTGTVAVVAALIFIIHPPEFSTVPVQERRPPPRGTLTHNTGRIFPAPLPSAAARVSAPCSALSTTVLKVGVAGAVRLRAVLSDVCRLAQGGVAPELTTGIEGLKGTTIRFAVFQLAGVESTADFATKTIWLNIKFSRSNLPVEQVAPVIVHEGYHLAHSRDAVTATQELGARRAEVAACRELISVDSWPRWCKDARALTDLPAARALELLVSAGYRP